MPKVKRFRQKQVSICGFSYLIVYDAGHSSSCGDTGKQMIGVGTVTKNEEIIFANLFHEISETIMMVLGFRYGDRNQGEDRIKFVMDHKEFSRFTDALANALRSIGRATPDWRQPRTGRSPGPRAPLPER